MVALAITILQEICALTYSAKARPVANLPLRSTSAHRQKFRYKRHSTKASRRSKKTTGTTTKSLPKDIKVAGITIPVIRTEIPDNQESFGFFQAGLDGTAIVVDTRIKDRSRLLAVFLHELVHAIDEGAGLGLKHNQVAGLGEMLAQSLAPHVKWGK